jgi:hypothetical protein
MRYVKYIFLSHCRVIVNYVCISKNKHHRHLDSGLVSRSQFIGFVEYQEVLSAEKLANICDCISSASWRKI